MRIYKDPMQMVREVERDLFEMGVKYQSETVQDKYVGDDPRFNTVELIGYQYSLKEPTVGGLKEVMAYLNANADWAEFELIERIQGTRNPGRAWLKDKKWDQFLRDGKFAYHYPERLAYQLEYVIHELKKRPNTRQAVMTMYDVHQDLMNWGGRDRVPCSMYYDFILRSGELTLIYHQRSCDFLKFFATDVYITCRMMSHVGAELGVASTRFIHVLDSLHAFAGDLEERKIF